MEVASAAAERIDLPRPPLDPSLSKRASDVVSDSSTSPNGSSTTSTPDRYDPSNSSPNPSYREVDIQSPAALRSEEYRQLFRLPPEEFLVQDFNCAFQESILLQGHMYLFVHYLCFYSNIFGFETKRIIAFNEITSVKRAKTVGIFPNAIEIFAGGKKFFFASFLSRDEAFKLINDGRKQHSTGAKEIKEQQEPMSESRSQENGFFAFVKENSSKNTINDMESTARDEDVPTSSESNVPSSANGAELVAESVINTRSSAPADCSWKPDHSYSPERGKRSHKFTGSGGVEIKYIAPCYNFIDYTFIFGCVMIISMGCFLCAVPEGFTKVAETKFQMKVEEFFNLYFSDKAVNFIESFHRRCGDKEFSCSSWCPHDKFGHVRDVSFQHPIKLYFGMSLLSYMNLFPCIIIPADFSIYLGANFGSCQETQKFRIYRNSHLVIETSQEINNVPYGDYFIVEGLWSVERDTNAQREDCILRVYVNLAFSKRTVWKGKIVQSTLEECREAYATWIAMAHELLQQNNDKQVLDPSGSSIENVELQIKREVATKDPSERSHNSTDPVRTFQISDSSDVNQPIGNLWQGTKASSITYLFREVVRKSYGYLKSHGHISVVLGVAFTVMFLMQVSIIVLLNRRQQVHVSYPVACMGTMGVGEGPWLEKRMHQLKEEMMMVEARLEKMWLEHSALKARLKGLGI
ncbi:hypothetical protein CXB51_021640 [Gossypium anomalum]|uniref:VASt domain-containing protein n=1 Tax=Gossypium anomalum TaxID=47600 RepID=A0A8J6CX32_9ROSI|nr:hypothetical protein CXB51_021640 [Gossypium anomalum]